jgi:hypothetical protein
VRELIGLLWCSFVGHRWGTWQEYSPARYSSMAFYVGNSKRICLRCGKEESGVLPRRW